MQLTLDGARTFRVRTVDRRGEPVPDAKVMLSNLRKSGRKQRAGLLGTNDYARMAVQWPDVLWPKTDKTGIAVFAWLPDRFEGASSIFISHNDYFAFDEPANVVADKPVQELTITLLPMEKLSGTSPTTTADR